MKNPMESAQRIIDKENGGEDISIITEKLKAKYGLTGVRAETNFSQAGHVKVIDDKVFFIYKAKHMPRDHGRANDVLCILNKNLDQLFEYNEGDHHVYDNYHQDDHEKNFTKPEKELKEVVGIKGNTVEVLNGEDKIITIEVPEGVLEKKE